MNVVARFLLVAVSIVCAGGAITGCATAPTGRTQVILMPDEDGHVGAVNVSSATGTRRLDVAFAQVTVDTRASAPSEAKTIGVASVKKDYAGLLAAQPSRPLTFTLNFLLDSTTLTDDSKALLPTVLQAVRDRKPTEITVFGHSDASGHEEHNVKLSADRARAVAALLRKDDPGLQDIDVQYFGDRQPIVRAEPRDARNRRAEILIL